MKTFKAFLTFLLMTVIGGIFAQTVITGTVTDTLNKPIPFAIVYLAKTTIGTTTDSEGKYLLKVPQPGHYQLFASGIGYYTNGQNIFVTGKSLKKDIKLSVNYFQLTEVKIKSSDVLKKKYYRLFVKQFIGDTHNSLNCSILNPEDLHIYKDADNFILKGFSIKPLKIENKALGYTIVYDLSDFSFHLKTGILKFAGNHYYQPIEGSPKKFEKWQHNRLLAYYGSRMHFVRTLYSNTLIKEYFQIFESVAGVDKSKTDTLRILKLDTIVFPNDQTSKKFYFDKPLYMSYYDYHPELVFTPYGYQADTYKSSVIFSDSVNIYQNGFYENPFSITWYGTIANDRLADMLPYDYYPNKIDTNLISKQKPNFKVQVFVHTDRNLYYPGDTLYFQAYIRDKIIGEFESASLSLYAMLYNEQGEIADSARYKIENACSPGWMTIPETAKPGKYRFVAFTSLMQNDDPKDAFQMELRVISNSDLPELLNIKNNTDSDSSIHNNFKNPINEQTIDLRFLPEGGNLLTGLEQKIGFNATDSNGEPVQIKGLLRNRKGEVLDSIKSGPYGPGFFICNPESGMYVELINKKFQNKIWPLPLPTKGMGMKIKPINDRNFSIEVQSTEYHGEKVYITGSMNDAEVFTNEINLDKKKRINVNTSELPTGVIQISLLNEDKQPVAQRLVYANAFKHLKFNITCDSTEYNQEQATEISVSFTDGNDIPEAGYFSIAAVDASSGNDAEIFNPGIEHTFNYHPYFIANLPSKVLLEGPENLTDEQRDLLLMVYGWSKIHWDESKKDTIGSVMFNYDLLNMKISFASKSRHADRRLDLVSLEGISIKHLKSDNKGEISFPLDSLNDDTKSVMLMPNTQNSNRVVGADLSIPVNNNYFNNIKLLKQQPVISITSNDNENEEQYKFKKTSVINSKIMFADSSIAIPEVTISRKVANNKEYKAKSLKADELWTAVTMEDAIHKMVKSTKITNEYIFLHQSSSSPNNSIPALIVLNGKPQSAYGWAKVRAMLPTDLQSLVVLDNSKATKIYGNAAK